MYFQVQTFRPGPMEYNLKLFVEEQGILKTLEIPFDAVCKADPNKPADPAENNSTDETEAEGGSEDSRSESSTG